MTRKTLHALVAIVAGLLLLLFIMQSTDRDEIVVSQSTLLPALAAVADNATLVEVEKAADGGVVLERKDDTWVVRGRDDYPADFGKLKELIVALAYATIEEEKTSNPQHYGNLSVDDPQDGGKGTRVTVSGPDFSYAVILGDAFRRESRYARVVGEPTSYLVDRNPDIPQTAGDWLLPEIVDIPSMRVRQVVIAHADGETLTISKTDEEQTDFDLVGIPEGRELSYATVGNGIAGALAGLELEDVRTPEDATPATTTVFETWDGFRVTAEVVDDGDAAWVAFAAGRGHQRTRIRLAVPYRGLQEEPPRPALGRCPQGRDRRRIARSL